MSLCKACQDEEMRISFDCLERAEAAKARVESYNCTCPLMPCDPGGPPHASPDKSEDDAK